MATIVLQVPDESLVTKVKQACKMLMGVTSVKVQNTPSSTGDQARCVMPVITFTRPLSRFSMS